jgi:hypothetical protein
MRVNLDTAIRSAKAGLHVFPCNPVGKRPSIVKWRDNSTTDIGIIESWWRIRANHLVAIDLHKAGLLAVDGDRHPDEDGEIVHDGVEALRNLFIEHRYGLKQHPVVRTPADGVHVYFRCPPGFGNREGNLPDGINIRGSGGYTIAPGCVRHDGHYQPEKGHPDLLTSFGSIPELPPWLAEIISPPAPSPIVVTRQSGKRFHCYAAAALTGKAKELAGMAPNTGRNNALNTMAWQMGTMANRGWIDRSTVEAALFAAAWSLAREDGARAVRQTIASGFNAGLAQSHPDLRDGR